MADRPIILSIANQKGGVGKTTTVVNLAAGLARQGYRVMVLDLDIQANATHILYRPLEEDEPSLAEVLLEDANLDETIFESNSPGVWICPSGETMVRVDLALAGVLGREEALKRALEDSETASTMDFIIIDTSPYLGLLTVNALVASDQVVVPVSCEYLPMLGLKLFLGTIRTIQRRLNSGLNILGYLLTMYDRRERITFDVERTMKNHFKELIFSRPIRINTHHKVSPSRRQTIFQYEPPSGRGVEDYTRLTREVLQRLELPESVESSESSSQAETQPATQAEAPSTAPNEQEESTVAAEVTESPEAPDTSTTPETSDTVETSGGHEASNTQEAGQTAEASASSEPAPSQPEPSSTPPVSSPSSPQASSPTNAEGNAADSSPAKPDNNTT